MNHAAIVFSRERDGHVAAGGREFQRVEQHIPEDLLQAISVGSRGQRLVGLDEPYSDAFLLGHLGRRFHRAADDVRQAMGFQIERQFAARGAIQLEKIFDQPELEEGVALDHLDRAGDLSRMRPSLSMLVHPRIGVSGDRNSCDSTARNSSFTAAATVNCAAASSYCRVR